MAGGDDWAINLRNVRKVYKGRIEALRGIEMRVRGGEIFGLLGPNGAGKSTLVKIMMTVVRATSAEGTLLGAPIGHKPTLQRVGYLPENHRFPRYLSGRQVLEFFAALSNVDRATRKRRAAELLDIVGMTADAGRRIGTYSKGMMQRIGLAQALMNDPDLVLLDEPTDGVDPIGRRDIRQVLTRLRDRGKTVFINSHMLSEMELLCSRVAILSDGQVVVQGTLDELASGREYYEIEFAAETSMQPAIWHALPIQDNQLPTGQAISLYNSGASNIPARRSSQLPGGQVISLCDATLQIRSTETAVVQPLIDLLRAKGVEIRRVQLLRPSLEELFMEAIESKGAAKP